MSSTKHTPEPDMSKQPSPAASDPAKMSDKDLDAAVAEKVMGWAIVRDIRFWDHSNNNGRPCFVQYAEGRWGVVRHGGSGYEPWSPSTSIEAAWSVEDRIDTLATYKGKVVVHEVTEGNTTTRRGCPLRERYLLALIRICCPRVPEFEKTCMGENNWFRHQFQSNDLWALIHATPRQRCLSALAAVREEQ